MSDPLAVSILAKVTNYYDFEGNFNDSTGNNNLTSTASAGFGVGKVGQEVLKGATAYYQLPSPLPITSTSGQLSIGGWIDFTTAVPVVGLFGFTASQSLTSNETFFIANDVSNSNRFTAYGFYLAPGLTAYKVADPSNPSRAYPITVKVIDSVGGVANSPQVINIQSTSGTVSPGFYYVCATFNNGLVTLYVNGVQVATGTVPAGLQTPTGYFQIADQHGPTQTYAGLDCVFACTNAVMTPAEIAWLFNNGAGRSYAQIQALAA